MDNKRAALLKISSDCTYPASERQVRHLPTETFDAPLDASVLLIIIDATIHDKPGCVLRERKDSEAHQCPEVPPTNELR